MFRYHSFYKTCVYKDYALVAVTHLVPFYGTNGFELKPMHVTTKLTIYPGLSLREEPVLSYHFSPRRAVWEEQGGTEGFT
jgi:hypothetical protein